MASLLKAKGLHTFVNELSEVPQGALLQADNCIIDRDSIIESRRGFNFYGDDMPLSDDRANQLIEYKGRILRHFGTTMQYDSNGTGTFQSFAGSYSEVETGYRVKYQESKGNLYFTTDEGIKKISARTSSDFNTASGYIVQSGIVKALDIDVSLNYATSGFLSPESKCGYRIVWGINDVNGNLLLGSPSARAIATNIDTVQSSNVDLSFPIPSQIDNTNYFFQVYRTAVFEKGGFSSLDDVDPGDEMNLVYEASVTETELTNGEITFTDITPESFRVGGLPLYTNPNTGEGILASNDRPPLAKDLELFKNTMFYSNTKTLHRYEFNLLSVSGFTSGTTKIYVGRGGNIRKYTFVGQQENLTITTDTKANTASGSYIIMYSAQDERKYVFWFDKTGTDVQPSASDTDGAIFVKVDISAATSAADVSAILNTSIDGIDDFSSTDGTGSVAVVWFKNGNVTDTTFGSTAPGGAWALNTTQQGDGENADTADGGDVLLSSLASPAQAVDETARSLVKMISRDSNSDVNAFYLTGADDLPGRILLEARGLTDDEFYVGINDSALVDKFNPTIGVEKSITNISVGDPTTITSTAHGLTTGDQVVIFDSDSTPAVDDSFTVTVVDSNNFTIDTEVTSLGTTGSFFQTKAISDNEDAPNRVYFSKISQPESVPIVNFIDVGPKDSSIERIIALRDSLFIFKDDAIYRLVGEAGSYSVNLFDTSARIIAPDSAQVLNNNIFVLTDQGVTLVSDTGVGIVSRPIENLINSAVGLSTARLATFGVSYELDRAYILWLPETADDTVATQAFRYNVFTKLWTRWTKGANSGVVNKDNNTLYIGASDTNSVEKERKASTADDFADREYNAQIVTVNDNVMGLSAITNVSVGDAIKQTQYLTISQFNRLLGRLDVDPTVNDTDYLSTLEASSGDNLTTKISDLASKLDSDSGINDTDYAAGISGSSDFSDIQDDFNIIIVKLNNDTGVRFDDYRQSTGVVEYNLPIIDVSVNNTTITLRETLPFIQGVVSILKAIPVSLEWAPAHFGSPEKTKQVREGTVIFEKDSFTAATVSYRTDLSAGYESIEFSKFGSGDWGLFSWGSLTWGGEGSSTPLRTLIPRNKQRCRYINCRFQHNVAIEKWAILGMSYEAREMSSRGYR